MFAAFWSILKVSRSLHACSIMQSDFKAEVVCLAATDIKGCQSNRE